jgi:CubicO group peptidase (beta-lactamase class C family)
MRQDQVYCHGPAAASALPLRRPPTLGLPMPCRSLVCLLLLLGCPWAAHAGDLAAGQPAPGRATDAVPPAWAAVDQRMRSSLASIGSAVMGGMGLAVYDAADRLQFERMYGDFAADRMVAIASASKWVSGLVLLDVIATSQGALTLESTTGQILHWTGAKAAITLRQLMSFTSGLESEAASTADPTISLAACVDLIAASEAKAAPGVRFDYGSTHLQVAARMAEVVTGSTWNALFRERVGRPLGLPEEVAYYTWPKQARGLTNPLIAGGMRASMASYARILQQIYHCGHGMGVTLGSDALFAAQAREPFAVVIGKSPAAQLGLPYHYGLCAWLETATPRAGSDILSSAGAFGFVPWVDRHAGYYAILGMEIPAGTRFSLPLEQALQPLIRAALSTLKPAAIPDPHPVEAGPARATAP